MAKTKADRVELNVDFETRRRFRVSVSHTVIRAFKKSRPGPVRTTATAPKTVGLPTARFCGCLCATPCTAPRRRLTARVATAGGGVNTAVGGRPRPRRRTAVAGAAPTPTSRKRRVGYQDRCNRRTQPPPPDATAARASAPGTG